MLARFVLRGRRTELLPAMAHALSRLAPLVLAAALPLAQPARAQEDPLLPANQPENRFKGQPPAKNLRPLPAALERLLRGHPTWFDRFTKEGVILRPEDIPGSATVFNPSAVVKDGKVNLLIRREDHTGAGKWFGTSTIWLGESTDGLHFTVRKEPVLTPTEPYEENAGVEDPRAKTFRLDDGSEATALTYTAVKWDEAAAARGESPWQVNLALAVSRDLVSWRKLGLVVPGFDKDPGNVDEITGKQKVWSKSGALVRVGDSVLMYFGDRNVYLARWTWSDFQKMLEGGPLVLPTVDEKPVLERRPGFWDGNLVEPAFAFTDKQGRIHLVYNGDAPPPRGSDLVGGYAAGEVVFAASDPRAIVRRSATPFLYVTEPGEKEGQVGNVIFLEGMAELNGRVHFYYGGADSRIFAATARPRDESLIERAWDSVRGAGARVASFFRNDALDAFRTVAEANARLQGHWTADPERVQGASLREARSAGLSGILSDRIGSATSVDRADDR